jgi:hypothetical protein
MTKQEDGFQGFMFHASFSRVTSKRRHPYCLRHVCTKDNKDEVFLKVFLSCMRFRKRSRGNRSRCNNLDHRFQTNFSRYKAWSTAHENAKNEMYSILALTVQLDSKSIDSAPPVVKALAVDGVTRLIFSFLNPPSPAFVCKWLIREGMFSSLSRVFAYYDIITCLSFCIGLKSIDQCTYLWTIDHFLWQQMSNVLFFTTKYQNWFRPGKYQNWYRTDLQDGFTVRIWNKHKHHVQSSYL